MRFVFGLNRLQCVVCACVLMLRFSLPLLLILFYLLCFSIHSNCLSLDLQYFLISLFLHNFSLWHLFRFSY